MANIIPSQLAKLLLRKQDSVKDRKVTPPGPVWSKILVEWSEKIAVGGVSHSHR